MAAGSGFKTWNTGDVLSATDVNEYLMQGIWVFDDAADRTAQVTSPAEGNFSYLRDTNKLYYYTGSAWAEADTSGILPSEFTAKGDLLAGTGNGTFDNLAVGANNTVLTADSSTATGLKWAAAGGSDYKLIRTTSFSAVASVSEDNVFTSTYENYKLIINIFPTSTSDSITMRLRASGSDTTANYASARVGWNGSVVFGGSNNTGTDDWYFGIDGNANTSAGDLTLFRPNIAGETSFTALGSGVNLIQFASGRQTDSTQFDGFKLAIISGTFTGNVSVYGLAK